MQLLQLWWRASRYSNRAVICLLEQQCSSKKEARQQRMTISSRLTPFLVLTGKIGDICVTENVHAEVPTYTTAKIHDEIFKKLYPSLSLSPPKKIKVSALPLVLHLFLQISCVFQMIFYSVSMNIMSHDSGFIIGIANVFSKPLLNRTHT